MIDININKKLYGQNGTMNLKIKLNIKENNFIALTGKSGSGKTTLLRILAGLEKCDGKILVNKELWNDNKKFLIPQKRKIGFVFQNYALFENMNLLENLLYVQKNIKLANKLLDITELSQMKNRSIQSLSGGQKQRVSLCRALMNNPKILLLDEPLSALDTYMRNKLQDEILTLHNEFNLTTIMVSHDVSEIYKLSNRVILLENGKIIKDGNAKDVLLQTQGSAKFSFEGKLLEIKKIDVIFIALIAIGQQIVEVVLSNDEAKNLSIGQKVRVSTKAFSPTIST